MLAHDVSVRNEIQRTCKSACVVKHSSGEVWPEDILHRFAQTCHKVACLPILAKACVLEQNFFLSGIDTKLLSCLVATYSILVISST